MNDLTREQQKLLVSMYKEVLSRQSALSFDDANGFKDSNEIIDLFCPSETSEHVATLCLRLKSKGYITCDDGDSLASEIELTDKTIVYMENRFKNGLKSILSFLSQFK